MKIYRLMLVVSAIAVLAAACGSGSTDAASSGVVEPTAVVVADAVTDVPPSDDGVKADEEADQHMHGAVVSSESADIDPAFDLLETSVTIEGDRAVFRSDVVAGAGSTIPDAVGSLDQASVWSYVWPTTLDSSTVGFDSEQGILALAATSHPDFDDTPLYDEDGDGDSANDGAGWHAHWVVLVEAVDCGGGLSVRGIPEGETPTLPATWPELPILIDSPDIPTSIGGQTVEIRVPISDIGSATDFNFDGVTSGLRVSTSPHDPLLCVNAVFDVASGDLSLPGVVGR